MARSYYTYPDARPVPCAEHAVRDVVDGGSAVLDAIAERLAEAAVAEERADCAPAAAEGDAQPAARVFARIRRLYESRDSRLCVFEDARGHVAAVRASRLA